MIDWEIPLSDKQKDNFSVIFLLGFIVVRFYKTILCHQTISKLFLVAHWDSLFYSLRQGSNFNMDCSVCQLLIPYRFFVSNYWHHGLPLWNPLNGFGMPLLADPQALVFAPLNILFNLFPNMYMWDLMLIIQLAIAAIAIYYLCKELEFNFVAGLVAALLFILCPWLNWQIELSGTGTCFVPLAFLFFTKLGKKASFKNIALAGCVAAFDILSSHPEIAFVTIIFASLWMYFINFSNNIQQNIIVSLKNSIVTLLLVGAITFGLCAPMLIPFVEYLSYAKSYKLDVIASIGLPWQAILANYLFPFQPKASLFLGILSILGPVAALCFVDKSKKFTLAIIICFIISVSAAIRYFFVESLFHLPPFSMTFATYWLPEYILFISILSGIGCSYLIEALFTNSIFKNKKGLFSFLILSILLLALPALCRQWHHNNDSLVFDQTFELPHFNFKVWISNLIFSILGMLALFGAVHRSRTWKIIAGFIFIGLGIASLLLVSVNSLIVRPAFEFPAKLPFKAIRKDDRILSVGDHLLRANTNLIYELPLLQSLNPIFPKGFIDFSKICGARADQYSQIYLPEIDPLLRLAGVNRILSEQPILDSAAILKTDRFRMPEEANFSNLLSLSNVKLFHDPKSSTVFFTATIKLLSRANYHLCFNLENNKGNPLCYTEPLAIEAMPANQYIVCSAFIPKEQKDWKVSIKIMQDKDHGFLIPQKVAFGQICNNNAWQVAAASDTNRLITIDNKRFQLIAKHGSILEYEDKTAFPRYFFINKIDWLSNKDNALDYLVKHTNELDSTAILEDKNKNSFTSMSFDQSGTIKSINSDSQNIYKTASDYSLTVETKNPAFLVITDIFYPGWNVYIDNQKSKIFRTDYLFRGVIIPAGKHTVRFIYQPMSLTIGFALFGLTLTSLILFAIKYRIPSQ